MNVKQAANVLDLIEILRQPQAAGSARRDRQALQLAALVDLQPARHARRSRLPVRAARARGGYYPSPLWSSLLQQIERRRADPRSVARAAASRWSSAHGRDGGAGGDERNRAMFIAAVESPHAIRYTAPTGKLIPLHVTATGRALLSLLSPVDRAGVLRRATFERYTPTTLMSVAAVEKEIQRSLQRGWFEGAGRVHDRSRRRRHAAAGAASPVRPCSWPGRCRASRRAGKELARRSCRPRSRNHLGDLIPAETQRSAPPEAAEATGPSGSRTAPGTAARTRRRRRTAPTGLQVDLAGALVVARVDELDRRPRPPRGSTRSAGAPVCSVPSLGTRADHARRRRRGHRRPPRPARSPGR